MSNLNRRQALRQIGFAGAGAAIAGAVSSCTPGMAAKPNLDVEVLNFALNLEYLEAAFYLAAVGRINEIKAIGGSAEIKLPSGFNGTTPVPGLSDAVFQYATEIANDELAHVKAIRAALGTKAVDRPVLDLGPAF
ncbi:MAG: hypothetical protein C4333_13095, partial [Meiothermus sp.]